jgi:hypothetical protein
MANPQQEAKQFGRERNETLAGQVSLPSPSSYKEQHPVMVILNHNREGAVQSSYIGSRDEELTNQDFLDAEEAI